MNENWILILAKDNLSLTKNCLRSALAQSPQVLVLVLNNASQDSTGKWLASQRATLGLWTISLQEQRSVAACWNSGLEWIWARGGEKVLVLNNDTEARDDMVRVLAEAMDEGSYGLTTGVSVRTRDQTLGQGPSSGSDHPDLSGFMIPKATHVRVKFDERFSGAYCEDLDYHAQLWAQGIRVWNTGLPFLHLGSATIKGASDPDKKKIAKLADENREKFRAKWGVGAQSVQYDELFTLERFGQGLT